ncbi:MAG: glycosyltransferase family 39 protein, partial [Candidatus Eremiobacterota bacterium]
MSRLWWLPLAFLVAVRLHNATAYPPSAGYDSYAHGLYVLTVAQDRLPYPNEGWAMYHGPLYYVASAKLAGLVGWTTRTGYLEAARWVSTLASLGTLLLAFLTARRLDPRLAWASVTLLAMLPADLIVAPMVYNMELGFFFLSLFLWLLLRAWSGPPRLASELALGLSAGLALLTRPEGILTVGMLG